MEKTPLWGSLDKDLLRPSNLIVEVLFQHPGHAQQAIENDIQIQNITYCASSSDTKDVAALTQVQWDFIHLPDCDTLVPNLISSFRYYGQVYQIIKYTIGEFFDGQVYVLIDNTYTYEDVSGIQVPVKPLSCNLYLSQWDRFVPTTFKGAPPVCYYCRQAGHLRANCPVLANKECYRCSQRGHTVHVRKSEVHQSTEALVKELSDADLIDDYLQSRANRPSFPASTAALQQEPQPLDLDKTLDSEEMNLDSNKSVALSVPITRSTTSSAYSDGTAFSKYASIDVAATMDSEPTHSELPLQGLPLTSLACRQPADTKGLLIST